MQLQIERNLFLNWKSSIERTFINWNTLFVYLTTKLALVFYWQRQEHHQSYGTIFPARCRQRDVQGPLSRINAISFNEQFLVAIYVISSVFMSIVCKNLFHDNMFDITVIAEFCKLIRISLTWILFNPRVVSPGWLVMFLSQCLCSCGSASLTQSLTDRGTCSMCWSQLHTAPSYHWPHRRQ